MPVYGLAECSVAALPFRRAGRGPQVDRVARAPFETEGRAEPGPGRRPDRARVRLGGPRAAGARGPHRGRRRRETSPSARSGRLVFRGPSMTAGYYRKPEATAAITLPGGWLDSGDLAYRADGEIYVCGRRKDLIIKGGRNLVPQEIEEAAARSRGSGAAAWSPSASRTRARHRGPGGGGRDPVEGRRPRATAWCARSPSAWPRRWTCRPTRWSWCRRARCRRPPAARSAARRRGSSTWQRRARPPAAHDARPAGCGSPPRPSADAVAPVARRARRGLYAAWLAVALPLAAPARCGCSSPSCPARRFAFACRPRDRAGCLATGRLPPRGSRASSSCRGRAASCWPRTTPPTPTSPVLMAAAAPRLPVRGQARGARLSRDRHLRAPLRPPHGRPLGRPAERAGRDLVAAGAPRGENVLFFPEGTFVAATGLRPFRLGAFMAAAETRDARRAPGPARHAPRDARRPGRCPARAGRPLGRRADRARGRRTGALVRLRDRWPTRSPPTAASRASTSWRRDPERPRRPRRAHAAEPRRRRGGAGALLAPHLRPDAAAAEPRRAGSGPPGSSSSAGSPPARSRCAARSSTSTL